MVDLSCLAPWITSRSGLWVLETQPERLVNQVNGIPSRVMVVPVVELETNTAETEADEGLLVLGQSWENRRQTHGGVTCTV